jgi:hypothetical protein
MWSRGVFFILFRFVPCYRTASRLGIRIRSGGVGTAETALLGRTKKTVVKGTVTTSPSRHHGGGKRVILLGRDESASRRKLYEISNKTKSLTPIRHPFRSRA